MIYLVYVRRFWIQFLPYTAARSQQQTLERVFVSPKPQKRICPPAHRTPNHSMKHCWQPDVHAGTPANEYDTTELVAKHTSGCPTRTKKLQSIAAGNRSQLARNLVE